MAIKWSKLGKPLFKGFFFFFNFLKLQDSYYSTKRIAHEKLNKIKLLWLKIFHYATPLINI